MNTTTSPPKSTTTTPPPESTTTTTPLPGSTTTPPPPESTTTTAARGPKGCVQTCGSLIFAVGLIALCVWLYLRVSNPSFSIEDFSVKPASAAGTTSVSFKLRLKNPNPSKGIYYDDVKLAFYMVNGPDRARGAPVGNYTVRKFYQGYKKRTRKAGSFETRQVNWTDLTAGSGTGFRVDLETNVRFTIVASKTKRHRQKVGGDVSVKADGDRFKSKKWSVRLSSGVAGRVVGFGGGCVGFLVGSFVFVLLNFGSRI